MNNTYKIIFRQHVKKIGRDENSLFAIITHIRYILLYYYYDIYIFLVFGITHTLFFIMYHFSYRRFDNDKIFVFFNIYRVYI